MRVAVGLVLNATAERIAAERIIALLRANDAEAAEPAEPTEKKKPEEKEKKKPTEKKK